MKAHLFLFVGLMVNCVYAIEAKIPECRLDETYAHHITSAFETVKRFWPTYASQPLPYDGIVVNRDAEPETLQVYLIKDAYDSNLSINGCIGDGVNRGRLDALSVTSICQVHNTSSIHCSAGAISELVENDRSQHQPNIAITLLLTHELSHLINKDLTSQYKAPLKPLSRSLSEDTKWRTLINACDGQSGTDQQRAQERRADQDATSIVKLLIEETSLADRTAEPAAIRSTLLGALGTSLASLRQWQARWFGRLDLPLSETPVDDDDPIQFAQWAADQLLCNVFSITEGIALVPQVGAIHPLPSERLAHLSNAVASIEFPTIGDSTLDQLGTGNANQILTRLTDIIVKVDQQYAVADKLRTKAFCDNVFNNRLPDCDALPDEFPRQSKLCPLVTATVEWQPTIAEPITQQLESVDGKLLIEEESLSFIRSFRNDAIVVGGIHRVGFIRQSNITWYDLPCQPNDALETKENIFIACDSPELLIRIQLPNTVTLAKVAIEYNGEPDSESSSLEWLGQIDDKIYAVFQSGSGDSQTIIIGDDQWSTALPWQGRGCDTLVYGMKVNYAGGRITGVTAGQPSILRTARFNDTFTKVTHFTAWPNPEAIVCGFGSSGPLCVNANGDLVDPEHNPQLIQANIDVSETVEIGNVISANLCSVADHVFFLVYTQRYDGNFVVELHEISAGHSSRLLHDESITSATLSCSTDEATIALSNGFSSSILQFSR